MRIGEIDDGIIHLTSTRSFNNRLILEKYVKGEIRKKITNGFYRTGSGYVIKCFE